MRLTAKISAIYDSALALMYPQPCVACELESVETRANMPACSVCWDETRVFTASDTLCWKCGTPARASIEEDKRPHVRCRRCDADDFTAARACGIYEGALRASVLYLKRAPHVGQRLAQLLGETHARAPLSLATLIVPVPLHPDRERERGFNQAAVLSRCLAARTRLPIDESSLVRTTHTERHRAGMDARARRKSVEDAFRVTRPRMIDGEHVLVVDDVFTTGATVSACAKALRAAGAREVFVLTVARVE